MKPALKAQVKDRLANWKFREAHVKLVQAGEGHDVVTALDEMFGDCGWFDGHMATILEAAVDRVFDELDEETESDLTSKN